MVQPHFAPRWARSPIRVDGAVKIVATAVHAMSRIRLHAGRHRQAKLARQGKQLAWHQAPDALPIAPSRRRRYRAGERMHLKPPGHVSPHAVACVFQIRAHMRTASLCDGPCDRRYYRVPPIEQGPAVFTCFTHTVLPAPVKRLNHGGLSRLLSGGEGFEPSKSLHP